ncbi:MAG: DDE-type integrase/transposase/recombinase [Bdellovibrionia bacterium]
MIEAYLKREGHRVSRSTICHVLRNRKKKGYKQYPRLNPHNRRYELTVPGERFQVDVKYIPQLIEGRRAYNFVAIDECTRWRYAHAYQNLDGRSTYDLLTRLKAVCPFPVHCIQTDCGFEFTYKYGINPNEHPLTSWCKENDVHHRLLYPGAKELNGKVERSHRIDEQYFFWKKGIYRSLEVFNQDLSLWLRFYNFDRLHGGIGYLTPIEKLKERLTFLESSGFESPSENQLDQLEKIRIKFLEESSKRLEQYLEWQRQVKIQSLSKPTRIDRMVENLERQLLRLKFVA